MTEENKNSPSFQGTSLEFQLLGQKFTDICKSNGLDQGEIQIIDEIYKAWYSAIGNPDEKARIAVDKIGDNPKRPLMLKSVMEISAKYIEDNPLHPLSKYAAKSKDN